MHAKTTAKVPPKLLDNVKSRIDEGSRACTTKTDLHSPVPRDRLLIADALHDGAIDGLVDVGVYDDAER